MTRREKILASLGQMLVDVAETWMKKPTPDLDYALFMEWIAENNHAGWDGYWEDEDEEDDEWERVIPNAEEMQKDLRLYIEMIEKNRE